MNNFDGNEVFEDITTKSTFSSYSDKKSLPQDKILDTSTEQQAIEVNNEIIYKEVEDKVIELLPNAQIGLKIVLAVVLSCCSQNSLMLWMLLVGVPSSGKTDLVRLVKDSGITYYLDNLTQNAFISGERETAKEKVHDLLPLLNKKCLIIKDWTSIFSLDEKMTKKLLGDLVGIYDKEFTKFSSRRGKISYFSAFSQIGCITPATLNKHTQYMNMVGPRFLCFSMPATTSEDAEKSYESIFSNTDRTLIENEARICIAAYIKQLIERPFTIKPISTQTQFYLRTAAELMSNCRGIAILQSATFRSEENEEVKYYEVSDVQIEEPWRAVQQIILLARYLAFVVGNNEVTTKELSIVKEVVISSMPADRSQALRAIIEQGGIITAKQFSGTSERSIKTSRRLLDELVALKVLKKIKGIGAIATDYTINKQFKNILLLDSAEFMSSYSSGTETPQIVNTKDDETTVNLIIPSELENIDKSSPWAQYLPKKLLVSYSQGELEQSEEMLHMYPQQFTSLLGNQSLYDCLVKKIFVETERRRLL